LSLSAGSFVCNQVFYGLLHALRRQPQVLAEQLRGLELVVNAFVQGIEELQVPGGQTD
jgi:hypothetical protein